MPIRIKPVHDLGPCIIDLDGLKGICTLVDGSFGQALYSGDDDTWEIYDEPSEAFIQAVSDRRALDHFVVSAEDPASHKKLEISFGANQATVKFSAPVDQRNWFDHFLIDLRKNLRPPFFRQRILADRGKENSDPIAVPVFGLIGAISYGVTDLIVRSARARYCYIILRRNPPNPFVENVKANLASNLIWVMIVFVAGALFTLLATWILRQFGVDINSLLNLSSIPTVTPTP